MPAPVLLAVVADSAALETVEQELSSRYASHYRVVCTDSPDEAVAILTRLSEAQEDLALVLAGLSLDESTGSDLLERVRQLHPHARRVLLVSWGEAGNRPTAEAIFDAMALGRIDYYVLTPTVPPDELFHDAICGFLLEWSEDRLVSPHTVRVVGETWTGRAREIREALQSCAMPHAFILSDSQEGRVAVADAGSSAKLPLMILPDGEVLSDPTNKEIADSTGASIEPEQDEFDVVIVGAGPAGLSAAVYAASEGLQTLVVDEGGIGGQATSSSLIRNYLGFPRGVSGRRLARKAYEQAWIFGANFSFMDTVTALGREGERLSLTLSGERRVSSRAVLLATGATYRRIGIPALEAMSGAGVFYGGPTAEASAMTGKEAFVLGGANSAGQAALHLADYAHQVTIVVRADSLDAAMSRYLVREVEERPNIEVRTGTEVVGGGGDGQLRYLELRSGTGAEKESVAADGLFVLIGARPRTGWLPAEIARDERGFLLTGTDLGDEHGWPLERQPLLLETSMPGVFAVGDARRGSVKRVASAVGEGSIAIQLVHGLLAPEKRGIEPVEPARSS